MSCSHSSDLSELKVYEADAVVAPDASISSSMAFIDNFGALPEPQTTANPKMGFYQRINDPDVARIAEFIVAHRPFLNARELRELVRVPTPLELSREEGERLITYFINLVVPFKKAIYEKVVAAFHDFAGLRGRAA